MADGAEEKDNEARKLITKIGKQLAASKTCPSKDSIVKLLKQATTAFPELKQSESLKSVVKPLSDSLVGHGLLRHKDKDVKMLVGICLCEIIRVIAPHPEFSDAVFKDIFILLLSLFGELDDIASPYFSRRVELLETVAKLQFFVLMLDTGCEDLVLKMFKSFFNVVRGEHPQSLINSMSSIITRILEEKVKDEHSDPLNFEANITQPLLDVILQHIIKEGKGVGSASFALAVSVLKNCDGKLECYICQFLTSCILNRDAAGSTVKEFYHEILFQIFQIAPQMLLSVIPNLTHELLTDQVDVRIKALNLIRKLLSLPGNHIAREYRLVFIELLNRFSDKSAEVRLAVISCAKSLCLTNPSGSESLEVLSAIHGRLLDHDEKVRSEAVKVMCDVAKTNLNLVSSDLISGASERLRDKKISVRKITLQKLVELYHEYCTRCVAGITFLNEHIEQIPCKVLLLCFEKDCPEFRPQSLELVFADLFPASLSTEERTKHWILMFSIFKPPHVKALKFILHQKRRLQGWLRDYLDLWSRTEGNVSEDAERKLEALVLKMSACFCDHAKAKDCFNELTDKGTAVGLQQLFRKGVALDCQTTMDGYLRELGKQNLSSDFLHVLSTKASFNIFNSKHVQYILDRLSSDDAENKHLKDYSVQLLLTIIGAFPSLIRGSEEQFQLLLSEKVIPFNEQVIEMFAKEGSQFSFKLSDINMCTPLVKLCLEATRAQSKLAVSAIAALADTSEQFVLSELCKMLVDSLCSGQNTPTVLQSLGCVAQHFVSTFEAQEKFITQYIVEEIFQQNDALASKDLVLFHETSESCSTCKLKVFGLKTLVRSFLPHKHTTPSRSISFLMDTIHLMLQKDVCSDCTIPCKYDESHIRLAAAKSVFRLSRKWELHISPQIFRLTVLTSKDKSPWVRRSFVNKLHKLLRNQALPSRYACAFSFAAVDSLKDLRCDARKYLEEYIRKYYKGAQIHETMNMKEAANDPLYVTVFLIHVLAHDTDFPAPDCQDEDIYAKFLSPLFITLQAIVNVNILHSNSCHSSNVSSFLRNIFLAIKKAEDAVDGQMTPKLHLLADVGISILNSLNSGRARPHATGLILLPSSLYKSGPAETREANLYPSNGYRAYAHFTKKLVSSLKTEVLRIDSDVHTGQQIHEGSIWPKCEVAAKSGNMDDLEMNKINYQFDGPHTGNEELFKTLYQEVDTGQKINQIMSSLHGSARLHNEFTVGNENFKDTHINVDAKLSFTCGSVASRSLLSHQEAYTGSQSKEDTNTRCSGVCPEPSKLLRATDHMNRCSSKIIKSNREAFDVEHPKACSFSEICYHSSVMDDLDSINGIHQDLDITSSSRCHGIDFSTNDERINLGAFEYKSVAGSLPKNKEFCIGPPQAVKREKRRKDAVDVSTSEVINMDGDAIVPRRTRRRKI